LKSKEKYERKREKKSEEMSGDREEEELSPP